MDVFAFQLYRDFSSSESSRMMRPTHEGTQGAKRDSPDRCIVLACIFGACCEGGLIIRKSVLLRWWMKRGNYARLS